MGIMIRLPPEEKDVLIFGLILLSAFLALALLIVSARNDDMTKDLAECGSACWQPPSGKRPCPRILP